MSYSDAFGALNALQRFAELVATDPLAEVSLGHDPGEQRWPEYSGLSGLATRDQMIYIPVTELTSEPTTPITQEQGDQ